MAVSEPSRRLGEHPDRAAWAQLLERAPVSVTDAGFTEIAPGTVTTLASWRGGGQAARGTY